MDDLSSFGRTLALEGVKVLLVGEAGPDEGSLLAQLHSLGSRFQLATTPEQAVLAVETDRPDLVIIDAAAPDIDPYRLASHLKQLTFDRALPVMFACLATDLRAEIDGRDLGIDDCFARPIATDVLAARIRLVLRSRNLERSLRQQNVEYDRLNRELIEAREALNRELDLASRIQRSLLPESLPDLDRFQFAAVLRSSGVVSGDFYDIYRLDETHYGFYVADAIGHGVPAALLTIFVKKGIRTRDITPDGYRLLPPGEVLTRLNRDIMAAKLSANPFVTLFYAILDTDDATLTYASGGHPPALLLGAEGYVRPLLSDGALLGIFESDFTTGQVTLKPADRVVLYTDGIEQARSASGSTGLDALIAYFGELPTDAPNDAFTAHLGAMPGVIVAEDAPRRDDLAVLALRMLQ